MFTLIIEDKHGSVADEYTFEDGEFLIGRSQSADIILPSDNVSRRHSRLYTVDGKCYIEDLGSSNGVFVNGRRIHEVFQIQRSAQIKVGDYYLHIEGANEDDEERVYCQLLGQNLGFSDQVFKIQRTVTLIGRGKDCSLTLIDPSISRIHAKLTVDRNRSMVLEDLKSSNGTFSNNERIEVASVGHRDVIRIGNAEFIVDIPETGGRASSAVVADYEDWGDGGSGRSGLWIVMGIVGVMLALGAIVFAIVGSPDPVPAPSEGTADAVQADAQSEPTKSKEDQEREAEADEIKYHAAEGLKLVKKKKWTRALKSWQRVKELDPLNLKAQKAINQVKTWIGHKKLLDDAGLQEKKKQYGPAAKNLREILADKSSVYYDDAETKMKTLMEMKGLLQMQADPKSQSKSCPDLQAALAMYRDIQLIDPRDEAIADRLKKTEAALAKAKCK